ncbi:hypothetical protein GPECTOR_36g11 [Gonium pectorale]|uniref:Aspartate/glutamate/uridylate kinase domain-containing protein n=1 Tax=Gonium pectorale TaxID=33097 RepID=A0A150GBN1_GONPE|nr:hypothetical protein GPECTOR_36g11 [Gonium pectorale]|eukprot:KXZ47256.1 hypothetical protein GPECTOR_36g11 [Gonium pectorale]
MQPPQLIPGGDAPPPAVRRIVKLGGAAVTHKALLETLQADVLRRVCTSLAASGSGAGVGGGGGAGVGGASGAGGGGGTVVVHGAGSFGHHPASEYGVARGPLSDPRVRRGFALTRRGGAAGAPAVGVSPLAIYTTRNREVSRSGAAAVADCLASGLLPVLHGDAVLDEQLGCTILSGDTLVRDLAEALRPQFVVFLTNVPGVFDRPPEEPGARLLRRILVRRDGSWRVAQVEGGGDGVAGDGPVEGGIRMTVDAHDVTGGIALKVEEAARVARLGVPVLIAQAGSDDGDAACRLGPKVADGRGRGGAGAGAAAGGGQAGDGQGAGDAGPDGQAAAVETSAAAAAPPWRGTLVMLEE